MKKVLLSLAAVALSASFASADVFTYTATGLTESKVDYTATPGTAPAIEFITDKGTSSNAPAWYTDIRIYKGGKLNLTIPEDYIVEKVVFTLSSNGMKNLGPITASIGTIATQTKGDEFVTWTGEATAKELSFSNDGMNDFGTSSTGTKNAQFDFTSIEVTANKIDLGGKLPANIAFSESSYIVGTGSFFTPTLENPYNLPVTYTSSDESVLTIDDFGEFGIVFTIKGAGKATLTATTAETDEYAAGKASAVVTVMESATRVSQMIEKAPDANNEVLVSSNFTVVYKNGNYIYLTDPFGAGTLLFGYDTTYETGDILNPNWIATNATYNGLLEWKGNPSVKTNEAEYLQYPSVEAVTDADVNRVVYLKDVTFAAAPLQDKSTFTGTLADGTVVTFYNQFTIVDENATAGTYDVLCAVSLNTQKSNPDFGKLQLFPIEYAKPVVEPDFPNGFVVTSEGNAVTSNLTYSAGMGYTLTIDVTATTDVCEFTIEVPMGWDEIYTYWYDDVEYGNINAEPTVLKASAAEWIDPSLVGLKPGNTFKVATSEKGESYEGMMMLGFNGKVDSNNSISIELTAKKGNTDAVETIEAADADAEYFTLQGVKVANPENGIFVKVANGKATKVVVK